MPGLFKKIAVNQALEALEQQTQPKAGSEAARFEPRMVEGWIPEVSNARENFPRRDKTA